MKYSDIPVMTCRPEVTADLLKSMKQAQRTHLRLFLQNREVFQILVGKTNGLFIGEFLALTVDELLAYPISYFEEIASKYQVYFSGVQQRTIKSIETEQAHVDELFYFLRDAF